MASNNKLSELKQRQATPVVMIAVVVVLLLVLGTGGYFVFNGGWKTPAQQDDDYKHNYLPIMAAKHGDMEAFDAENKYRKEHGQPPLVMPEDKSSKAGNGKNSLIDLQKKLQEKGVGGSGQ